MIALLPKYSLECVVDELTKGIASGDIILSTLSEKADKSKNDEAQRLVPRVKIVDERAH